MHRAREKKSKRDVFARQIGQQPEPFTRPLCCWKCEGAAVAVNGYSRLGTAVPSHFRLAPKTEHEGTCPLNPTSVINGIAHGSHGLAQVDDGGILRLTLPEDLTTAPPAPTPGDADPADVIQRTTTTVRPLLPPAINSAAKIARFLQLHDFDPDIVRRFKVQPQHHRSIPWGQFCFGPTHQSYAELYERRRTQKTSTHPIAVYGTVQRIGQEGDSGRPYATLASNVPSGDQRVHVVLRSQYDTLIKPLAVGTHVLAVGDWGIFDRGRIPQLRLFADEHWQIAHWTTDNAGHSTEPACPSPVTSHQRVTARSDARNRRIKAQQPPATQPPAPSAARTETDAVTAVRPEAAQAPESPAAPPATAPPEERPPPSSNSTTDAMTEATAPEQPGPQQPAVPPPAPAVPPRPAQPPRPPAPPLRPRGRRRWFGRRR